MSHVLLVVIGAVSCWVFYQLGRHHGSGDPLTRPPNFDELQRLQLELQRIERIRANTPSLN